MEQAYRGLLHITDWASYLLLATMAVVVCVDVLCRYLLGFSTQISEEVASLGLVAMMFVSLPGAFEAGAFLRVDIAYIKLSGRLRRLLDILFHLAAFAVTAVYVVYVVRLTASSFTKNMHSDSLLATPNYVPQAAMVIGLGALLLSVLAGLVRCFHRREEKAGNDA